MAELHRPAHPGEGRVAGDTPVISRCEHHAAVEHRHVQEPQAARDAQGAQGAQALALRGVVDADRPAVRGLTADRLEVGCKGEAATAARVGDAARRLVAQWIEQRQAWVATVHLDDVVVVRQRHPTGVGGVELVPSRVRGGVDHRRPVVVVPDEQRGAVRAAHDDLWPAGQRPGDPQRRRAADKRGKQVCPGRRRVLDRHPQRLAGEQEREIEILGREALRPRRWASALLAAC